MFMCSTHLEIKSTLFRARFMTDPLQFVAGRIVSMSKWLYHKIYKARVFPRVLFPASSGGTKYCTKPSPASSPVILY